MREQAQEENTARAEEEVAQMERDQAEEALVAARIAYDTISAAATLQRKQAEQDADERARVEEAGRRRAADDRRRRSFLGSVRAKVTRES